VTPVTFSNIYTASDNIQSAYRKWLPGNENQ